MFVYILEHQYTEVGLSLSGLKGKDCAVGQHLLEVCWANGFFFFLARMDHEVYDDEGYGYDRDPCLKLYTVVTPEGHQLARSVRLEEDQILQEDPFERDADSGDEAEYTGNASMPATSRYHDTVRRLPSNLPVIC